MAHIIRPYGDTMDDGKVQLSFTLPVPDGAKGREAARKLVLSWGFKDCEVVHSARLSNEYSFYVAYGRTESSVDYDSVVADEASADASMDMDASRVHQAAHQAQGSDRGSMYRIRRPYCRHRRNHEHERLQPPFRARALFGDGSLQLAPSAKRKADRLALKVKADAVLISQVVPRRTLTFIT